MRCGFVACLLVLARSDDGANSVLAEQRGFLQNPKSPDVSAEALYYNNHYGGSYGGGGFQTTRHQSWFDRMKDAFIKVAIGIVLLIFSVPVLWVNEQRNAQLESVISCGEQDVVEGDGKNSQLLPDDGSLLHKEGEEARATDVLEDARFQVKLEHTLRMQTEVEVYQWVETKTEEEQEQLGGGKETITRYSYTQEWKAAYENGSNFAEGGHDNRLPNGLNAESAVGSETINSKSVDYGSGYTLPDELVSQLSEWQNANKKVGASVELKSGAQWTNVGEEYYYSRDGAANQPEIGDGRVSFKHIPDGPVTVLALQVEGAAGKKTFAPYRLVSRGFCGGASADDVKQKLIKESKVNLSELTKRTQINSPICCACNLVHMCFTGLAHPQIFKAWCGTMSKDDCFASLKQEAMLLKWVFRFVGWLMMYIGLTMLFEPIIILLAVIPFLAKLGSFIVGVVCFIISITISCVLVCLAYMAYHPIYAMIRLCIVVGVAAAAEWYLIQNSEKTGGDVKTE